jgi:outer membrane immunogenic protein
MLRTLLGVAGVSGLLLIAPLSAASAADMPLKAPPPPPPAPTWTGCYLSAGVGYGMFDDKRGVSFSNTDPTPIRPNSTSGGQGWLGAFGGGCDYQFAGSAGLWGPLVIGVFGDWDPAGISGLAEDPSDSFKSGNQNISSAWFVGARAGIVVLPGLLGYIDGGFTQAHVDAISFAPLGGCGGTCFDILPSANPSGGFVGGGYEYALPWLFHGLFWKTEYRFAFYDNYDQNYIHFGTPGQRVVHNSLDVQTVTSSLVWRFNWMGGY